MATLVNPTPNGCAFPTAVHILKRPLPTPKTFWHLSTALNCSVILVLSNLAWQKGVGGSPPLLIYQRKLATRGRVRKTFTGSDTYGKFLSSYCSLLSVPPFSTFALRPSTCMPTLFPRAFTLIALFLPIFFSVHFAGTTVYRVTYIGVVIGESNRVKV